MSWLVVGTLLQERLISWTACKQYGLQMPLFEDLYQSCVEQKHLLKVLLCGYGHPLEAAGQEYCDLAGGQQSLEGHYVCENTSVETSVRNLVLSQGCS